MSEALMHAALEPAALTCGSLSRGNNNANLVYDRQTDRAAQHQGRSMRPGLIYACRRCRAAAIPCGRLLRVLDVSRHLRPDLRPLHALLRNAFAATAGHRAFAAAADCAVAAAGSAAAAAGSNAAAAGRDSAAAGRDAAAAGSNAAAVVACARAAAAGRAAAAAAAADRRCRVLQGQD